MPDRFTAAGDDFSIWADLDETRCPAGVFIAVDNEQREERCAIILDPAEARGLAAWILETVPPVDHSRGRYCAICRHSGGEGPYLWCNHPVATHIDPILGKPVGQTASYMRAVARACGPAGKLFERIEPPAAAAD